MNLNENKVLFFIKYTPILLVLVLFSVISLYIYLNNYDLFKLYYKEFIFLSILILFISLYSSFLITYFLKRLFMKYTNKILNEIEENKKKDFLIFQQSKLVTIGELLGNISHQWRQPLNVITTATSGIKLQKEIGINNNIKELELLNSIMNSANYLTQTIDDFRDFYAPSIVKKTFSIGNCIDKCLKIITPQFKDRGIIIKSELNDFQLEGFESQLIQVLINLLNNSRDKFDQKNLNDKLIEIKTYQDETFYCISIADNTGRIEEEKLNKIFEASFTKYEIERLEIGLYMSQQIISKSFSGDIFVKNTRISYLGNEYFGVSLEIKIPI